MAFALWATSRVHASLLAWISKSVFDLVVTHAPVELDPREMLKALPLGYFSDVPQLEDAETLITATHQPSPCIVSELRQRIVCR